MPYESDNVQNWVTEGEYFEESFKIWVIWTVWKVKQ